MPRANPEISRPLGHAVEHRQLLGEAQRLVQRQEIAVDQQFEPFGALRRGGGQEVRRVHQAVRRAVMLVEPDAVIAQAVELFPGLEVLGIGARGDLGLEVFLWQWVGQFVVDLQVLELLTICNKIEDKDLHVVRHPPR
jgi:hypothetical protein